MAACTTTAQCEEISVGMGQIAVARPPHRFKSILGSCIGLAIYHPRLRAGAFGHIVLPESCGRTGLPGKFADTAIPAMLAQLHGDNVPAAGLLAKMVGGANMFGSSGPLQIGDANAAAIAKALAARGIRLAGKDVGGGCGRRVIFDCASGKLTVEIAGQSPRIL